MIGLIGAVGGAAALEIRRLRTRGNKEKESNDVQVQELKKAVEQYTKDLEQERRLAQTAARKAQGLEAEAESLRRDANHLREAADSLGRQKEELAQQNTMLLLNNLELSEKTQKMQHEANELALVNRQLADQVDALTAERDADASRFAADLASLRDRVADVLQRMFSNEIDEPAAVEALHELGCEVRFVPREEPYPGSSTPSYVFQPKLLLEDPARMARLMQAAARQAPNSPRAGSNGGLTPRIAGGGPAPPMHAALTIGSGSSVKGSDAPRFVLSWLNTAAESKAAATQLGSAGLPGALKDAVSERADTSKDGREAVAQASCSVAAAGSGSPKVSIGRVEQEGGNLVFSSESKGKTSKSRLGLSLAGSSGLFGGAKVAGASVTPSSASTLGHGLEEPNMDTGMGRDLVARK